MAGERRGQAKDVAGAKESLRKYALGVVERHPHGAFADKEHARGGIAATEENGASREGDVRGEAIELGLQFSEVGIHGNLGGHFGSHRRDCPRSAAAADVTDITGAWSHLKVPRLAPNPHGSRQCRS